MEDKMNNQEQEKQVVKKTYTPPRLTVYGKLTDLTAGGPHMSAESHMGSNPSPLDEMA
jgi:hypothetical protein